MKKIISYFVIFLVVGCSANREIVQPPIFERDVKSDYKIGVSDQLNISVWRNPELSVAIPVRPDGRISTPLVGDVLAAGKTPAELAADVKEKLTQFIRNPEVTVIVVSPQSKEYLDRIQILGAVRNPTSIPFQKGMTVLDLVLAAGGVTEFSAPNKTLLYRVGEDGVKGSYPVYLNDILKKGVLDSNFMLQPTDTITVPERMF